MAAKAPQLIQQYVTGGDRSLKDWHLLLRRVTFGAALVLMSASIVSLHWACNLIGLRGAWEPVAWMVPLAMEFGMAAVASTATTIRKDPKPGHEGHPGGYYVSLWIIFSFVMVLAQASNLGHAVVTVASNQDLPPVIPTTAVYVFACAFAALFPLGGTLFVHVSGFLRAHGTGARWIEEDAEVVFVQAAPGAPAVQGIARTPRTTAHVPAQGSAHDGAQAARAVPPPTRAPAQPAKLPTRALPVDDEKVRARAEFDRLVAADPLTKPDSAAMMRTLGIDKHPATPRRWVADWWAEHEASLGTARPDPIAAQIAAESAQEPSGDASRTA